MSVAAASLPLRIAGGMDLREALSRVAQAHGLEAAFVVSGIGSLSVAQTRFADARLPERLEGPLEILSLAGSLGSGGPHLHLGVADAQGRVYGGHMGGGCIVRTTAEVLLAPLAEWSFGRELDSSTGYRELVVRRRG
jgi:predicted DNA-binding protein with PD1-like motif